MRVLIIGAGGHAQVIADILLQLNEQDSFLEPIGYLDDNPGLIGSEFLGLPVLGRIDRLPEIPHDVIILAIGENRVRARIFQSLQMRGEKFTSAIHPSAVLARNVYLGQGVVICAGVVINSGTVIGDNVILNTSCSSDHHNRIDAHAHVAPGTHLGGHVQVGEGALLGIGAAVTPGCSIGEWSVIGAGAVVTGDIPSHATAVGSPARLIKMSNDPALSGTQRDQVARHGI